jgi:hypothetical protein
MTLRCPPEWIATRNEIGIMERMYQHTVSATDTASSQSAHANHGHTPS